MITTGSISVEAHEAVRQLANDGVNLRFVVMPFLKPIDAEAILDSVRHTPWIMTVEEHNRFGGLGSAVAEVLAESGSATPLRRLHLPEFVTEIGSQEHLRRISGIDARGIIEAVRQALPRHASKVTRHPSAMPHAAE